MCTSQEATPPSFLSDHRCATLCTLQLLLNLLDVILEMIDEDLIDTKTVGWTDDWNKGLDDGSIASLLT